MARTISAAGKAALAAGRIKVAYLFEVVTDEITKRINTLNFDISYDGVTWDKSPTNWTLPDGIPVSRSLTPEPFPLQFDGGDESDTSTFIGDLLTRTWHQRPVRFFGLLFDPTDGSQIAMFYEWQGRADKIVASRGMDGAAIVTLTCESGVFRALERNLSTVGAQDQKRRDATDTMFRNMALKQGQQVPFGVSWSNIPGYRANYGSNIGGEGGFGNAFTLPNTSFF